MDYIFLHLQKQQVRQIRSNIEASHRARGGCCLWELM